MNQIKIQEIVIKEGFIKYNYKIYGEWTKYFNITNNLCIQYSVNIEDIPYGIAVIPLLSNILPIAWIFDAQVIIDELDKDFYESIAEFKDGYIKMYPKLKFNGELIVDKVISYKKHEENNTLALFSGGVDAFHTLLEHIDEKPYISTVWGADIKHTDVDGWEKVLKHTKNTAYQYELPYLWIKSNFREFINEQELHSYVYQRVNDGWWHGFQHGLGLIGHIAPCSYVYDITTIYIASSFTIKEKGKITCASDPSIDNFIKFNGCSVKHDGYEYNRQQKVNQICKYVRASKKPISLRVCWQSEGGSNCCKCEKCYRTIFAIIANKEDPREYGFNYSDKEFKQIIRDIRRRTVISEIRWSPIQKEFVKNYNKNQVPSDLEWFYKKKIKYINFTFHKKVYIIKNKIKSMIGRV